MTAPKYIKRVKTGDVISPARYNELIDEINRLTNMTEAFKNELREIRLGRLPDVDYGDL